jgi:pyruvate carboxylase subunit B
VKYFVTIAGRRVEVVVDGAHVAVEGRTVAARLESVAGTPERRLHLDGITYSLAIAGRGEDGWRLVDAGAVREVEAVDERTEHIRSLAGSGRGPDRGGVVKAPMPGLVVRVMVAVGDRVLAGQGLVVLEAMKMENELKAPAEGRVARLGATQGAAVEKGAILVEIEGDQP